MVLFEVSPFVACSVTNCAQRICAVHQRFAFTDWSIGRRLGAYSRKRRSSPANAARDSSRCRNDVGARAARPHFSTNTTFDRQVA